MEISNSLGTTKSLDKVEVELLSIIGAIAAAACSILSLSLNLSLLLPLPSLESFSLFLRIRGNKRLVRDWRLEQPATARLSGDA